ncbi:MAG TPA: hypothetical protein DEQ09_10380 [Bacteroidales bacterium]|nr:hypothetical protein [Bacteroidales bacterium]
MHKSINLNPDQNGREFNEVWPGGRTNHYWFDLNRDYIMLQQPESIGRVAVFHRWRPNINTDHHEMGASSTFFFQPGIKTRENPFISDETYNLHNDIARFHQKYLDNIGSLYFSEEVFDDYYLGKGSAYPDIHGSIGILFEQAGAKGHLKNTPGGLLSFPFAIKNQFTVSLSTLEAGLNLREKLLQHQVDFYRKAMDMAVKSEIKAYVFRSNISGSILGPEIVFPPYARGSLRGSRDAYAWIFEWEGYYSPGALYYLLEKGLKARVAKEDFIYDDGEFKKDSWIIILYSPFFWGGSNHIYL